MSLPEGLEIYIPQEAEVKSVLLKSLPRSVLRKMGISADQLEDVPECPRCVWICPAFVKRKDQKGPPQVQGRAREQLLKMLGDSKGLRAGSLHQKMSFVSANCTAYMALKETLPGSPLRQASSMSRVPKGTLSRMEQDTVIIHQGQIYLSIKKCRKQEPQVAPLASQTEDKVAPDNNKLKLKLKTLDSSQRFSDDTSGGPLPSLSNCAPLNPSPPLIQSPTSCKDPGPTEVSPEQGPNLVLRAAQSWAPPKPPAIQQDFDYQELMHREKIALMQNKLLQSDAMLNNLSSGPPAEVQ